MEKIMNNKKVKRLSRKENEVNAAATNINDWTAFDASGQKTIF